MRILLILLFLIFNFFCFNTYSEGSYYSEVEILSQTWDTIQKVYVDFEYLTTVGDIKGEIDENSIKVYQIEGEKKIEVLSNFVKSEKEGGYIIFEVKGEKDPDKAIKKFHIYFDLKGKWIESKKKLEIKEANLVPNIGFEEEEKEGIPARTPYFYTGSIKELFDEGRISLDKQVYYKGKKSIKLIAEKDKPTPSIVITPYTGYKREGFSYSLRVQPGKKYKFGYWTKGEKCGSPVYKPGGNAVIVLSWINWYDKEGNYLSRNEIKGIRYSLSELPYTWDWVYNESIHIVPSNAYYGVFMVSFPCYEGIVWVDEPIIDLVDCPTLTEVYKK
ncbi:MAG: hypothetical protein NC915_00930 [Candidatus Omnitrophica bacterium]|nr:hypothetical protein [Candidatus Omnitrophota bacterium]